MRIPNSNDNGGLPARQEYLDAADESHAANKNFSDPIALFFLILRKWRYVCIGITATLLLGGLYVYLVNPIYRASARIEILNESLVEMRTQTRYERQEKTTSRQLLLLNSDRLHGKVRQSLADEWAGRVSLSELVVEHEFSTVPGSDGSMIDLTIDSVSPEYSVAYASRLIELYREFRVNELREVHENALSGLRAEEVRVANELDAAKTALDQFESEYQIGSAKEREAMDLAFKNELLSRLQQVRMERTILENQYETILESDVLTIREALQVTRETQNRATMGSDQVENLVQVGRSGSEVTSVGDRSAVVSAAAVESANIDRILEWEMAEQSLLELQQQYDEWSAVRKKEHPEMVKLEKAMAALRGTVEKDTELSLRRFQARFDALRLQESGLEQVLNEWEQEDALSIPLQHEYQNLVSTADHLERKYNLVYQRLLVNADSVEGFFLRHIRDPYASQDPIQPQKAKVLAASGFLGLVLAVACILALEYFRPNALNADSIIRDYHLSFLASIPQWNLYLPKTSFDPETDPFVLARGKNQIASETYRKIRLNLLNELGEPEKLSFAVTSANRGDGKTFNTANMAVPFAWEGKRVLLIDGDLRKSSLTRSLLGQDMDKGLADWLKAPKVNVRDYILKVDREGLSILPAGVFCDSLPELVRVQELRELIQDLYTDFDVIILDTAPVTILSETVLQCRATDGVVLMADEMSTSHDFKSCMNELRGVRVIGFCLNGVDYSKSSSPYGRSPYGSYGSYGHAGYGLDSALFGAGKERHQL